MRSEMWSGRFPIIDCILMVLVPSLLGSGIGLPLGLARGRPGRAALAGLAGGVAGAWGGVIYYYCALLPDGNDPNTFMTCVLAGLLLGAAPLGFYLAGPPDLTQSPPFKPAPGSVGFILGGILGLLLGLFAAYLSVVPGSAAGLEAGTYLALPMIGAIIGGLVGRASVISLGK